MRPVEWVKSHLRYDPVTGEFFWLKGRRAGKLAGSVKKVGYRYIRIDGLPYLAGRLACLYMTGGWPPYQIDHINHNRADDRWCNLRIATRTENMINTTRAPGESGIRGVSFNTRLGKFHAYINIGGGRKHLGFFDTRVEATAARKLAEQKYHGEFIPRSTLNG